MSVYIKSGVDVSQTGNDVIDKEVIVNAEGYLEVTPSPYFDDLSMGLLGTAVEVDPGEISSRLVRRLSASDNHRLRVAKEILLFQEQFAGTGQNVNIWRVDVISMAFIYANGFITLNSSGSTVSGDRIRIKNRSTFQVNTNTPTYVEFKLAYQSTQVQANALVEFGIGFINPTTDPTLGAFFRYTVDGELKGVVAYNSSETLTAAMALPSVQQYHTYLICIHGSRVEFWIDGVLHDQLTTATDKPFAHTYLPVGLKLNNSGTVSSGVKIALSQITVSQMRGSAFQNIKEIIASGGGIYQTQTGVDTPSQLANYANSTVPASATLSNTAAGYLTLGGQFQFAAVAGAETDYAIFAYLNLTRNQEDPSKNIYITGISIDTYNTGAANGATATILQWAVGIGATSVSLATGENALARATKRTALGTQVIPAASEIGFVCPTLSRQWDTPLFCDGGGDLGAYIHIILRIPIGLATASQIIRGVVSINGYFA